MCAEARFVSTLSLVFFFFRPNSLLKVDLRVDFFRDGGPRSLLWLV